MQKHTRDSDSNFDVSCHSTCNFIKLLLFFLIVFLLSNTPPVFANQDAKRLLSLVDYIGGDYKNAVDRDRIVNEDEYREMLEFSSEAIEIYDYMTARQDNETDIGNDLKELSDMIHKASSTGDVELLANALKSKIISQYKIVPYPTNEVSLFEGKPLYEKNCSSCHGIEGRGDGPISANLIPRPSSFKDDNPIGLLSPFKVYNTISFGIKGTSMPSFPALSDEEKWNIGFYVVSLRFDEEQSKKGSNKYIGLNLSDDLDSQETLAVYSDQDIYRKIEKIVDSKEDLVNIIAYLRKDGLNTSRSRSDAINLTSVLLLNSVDLYKQGQVQEAYKKSLDAYLDGFEQVEAKLRLKNEDLNYEIENKLYSLRAAMKEGKSIEYVENLHRDIEEKLAVASVILRDDKPLGRLLSFTNSFAIIVREGLEAVLIVAAIMAFLAASGTKKAIRYVHLGWIFAIIGGLITWLLARTVISISGSQREVIEGLTSLLAATVLFYVSYWLITKIEVQKWQKYIQGKVEKAISKKSIFALASVSFFAVYREAFETVLFYQALWFQAEDSQSAVIWGFVVGIVLLLALVIVIFRLALRVPLRYFFGITSFFLYFLSFVFMGKGVRELQEAGVIGISSVNFIPQIDILGIYPTLETSIPQGILILAFAVAIFWIGYLKREKEIKEIVVTVSRIADDMKVMHESFEHIKQHIVEWRRCEEIDLETEELDRQIKDVIHHVDELENKVEDFYDVVSKNGRTVNNHKVINKKSIISDQPKTS